MPDTNKNKILNPDVVDRVSFQLQPQYKFLLWVIIISIMLILFTVFQIVKELNYMKYYHFRQMKQDNNMIKLLLENSIVNYLDPIKGKLENAENAENIDIPFDEANITLNTKYDHLTELDSIKHDSY